MMRIGFDARWYNQSGIGTYITGLLKEFSEFKFKEEFDLIVFEDPENPVPAVSDLGILRLPVRSSKYSLTSQFELRALCKSAQIDLFHIPYQYGAPLLLPCPLVITIHDLIPFLFRTRSWPKQMAAIPVVKLGYRAAALRAQYIIADSINTARDIEKILKVPASRIVAIHLAAAPEFSTTGESRST